MSRFDNPRGGAQQETESADIKRTVEDLNRFLVAERSQGRNLGRTSFGGIDVSIQAGSGLYSTPRSDTAKAYTAVELGFPSVKPPDYIMEYAENKEDPTETVYGWVPIELVAKWIVEKGGLKALPAHEGSEADDEMETIESGSRELDKNFVGRTSVNGIDIVVEWDDGYDDYVVYLPQIELGEEASEQGIHDQLMRVTRRADVAKKVYDYTVKTAKTATDAYDLFKKVEAFSKGLPYELDDEGEVEAVEETKELAPAPKAKAIERALTPEAIREKLRDPNFLPTHDQITSAFSGGRNQFHEFCFDKDNPVFEFLNEEYLNAFADYFVERARQLGKSEDEPLVVLEIGAGNGRLTHFLQQKLNERAPGLARVVATDSGDWKLKTAFPVERLKHDEAMEKHSPDIVVFSWMPYQEDSSKDIRKFDSVKEYVLIGETDGGCCGDEWETWGQSWSYDDEGQGEKVPPYKADGFERENLSDLSDLQICRTDYVGSYYHSSTVSFKRKD